MIICLSIRTQGNSIPVYTHHDIKGVKKMPNIKSAKKRVKVNAKKAAANKAANSALKTAIKRPMLLLKQTQLIRTHLLKTQLRRLTRLLLTTSSTRTVQQERRATLQKRLTLNLTNKNNIKSRLNEPAFSLHILI